MNNRNNNEVKKIVKTIDDGNKKTVITTYTSTNINEDFLNNHKEIINKIKNNPNAKIVETRKVYTLNDIDCSDDIIDKIKDTIDTNDNISNSNIINKRLKVGSGFNNKIVFNKYGFNVYKYSDMKKQTNLIPNSFLVSLVLVSFVLSYFIKISFIYSFIILIIVSVLIIKNIFSNKNKKNDNVISMFSVNKNNIYLMENGKEISIDSDKIDKIVCVLNDFGYAKSMSFNFYVRYFDTFNNTKDYLYWKNIIDKTGFITTERIPFVSNVPKDTIKIISNNFMGIEVLVCEIDTNGNIVNYNVGDYLN